MKYMLNYRSNLCAIEEESNYKTSRFNDARIVIFQFRTRVSRKNQNYFELKNLGGPGREKFELKHGTNLGFKFVLD